MAGGDDVCGRIDLHTPAQEIARRFQAVLGFDAAEVAPGWNIPPTRKIAAIIGSERGRRLVGLHWGFVPRWARNLDGTQPINARSDSVMVKPMFRDAIRHRRCLIPVDGFFEWHREGARKQPYYFRMGDGAPFALGGIWDVWADRAEGEGYTLYTCAILTTSANALMSPVHDRMPVIVAPQDYDQWLAADARRMEPVEVLLRPFDSSRMAAYPVGLRANSASNDAPDVIEPVQVAGTSSAV